MLVKQAELKQLPMAERKLEGLKKRRKPNTVTKVLEIEKLWGKYALDPTEENMNKLLMGCMYQINKKVEFFKSNWGNKGLKKSDFESVFYEEVWIVCQKYTHYQNFYLYETIHLALHRRGIDITRTLLTKQGKFESSMLPLKEETADYIPDPRVNVERDVIDRDTVEQILNEDSLSTKERRLLQALYSNPELSYRDLAKVAGYNHHTEVTRSLDKIKMKINYIIS